MKLTIFLPVRRGSERVKNKNTRPFAGFKGGLLELKLEQLLKVKNVSEIVISTNDMKCKKITQDFVTQDNRIKIDQRPNILANSNTRLVDLIKYVPSVCRGRHILWTHVTSPFFCETQFNEVIDKYFQALENGNDSLMGVKKIKSFVWSKKTNDIINRLNNERWPRTQDLETLYEINSSVFVAPIGTYKKNSDRVGIAPYLYEIDDLSGFDIDWVNDFSLAESIYEKLYNN